MKKLYILSLFALIAPFLAAQVQIKPVRALEGDIQLNYCKKSHSGQEATPEARPQKAAPAIPNPHQWEDLGMCVYVDDLVTTYWSVGTTQYLVKVQKDAANEGVYRILDPWANYPKRTYVETHEDYPGTLPTGDDYYIILDARDPENVYVPESPVGIDDGDGPTRVVTQSEIVGKFRVTEESAARTTGKLSNGIITFPEKYALYLLQGNDYSLGNKFGGFSLTLPGGFVPIDYEFQISLKEDLCPDAAGEYHFKVIADERIPMIKYQVFNEMPSTQDAYNMISTGKRCFPDQIVTVNTALATSRTIWLMVCAYDEEGELKSAYYIDFYAHHVGQTDWAPLGKADLTEGFLSCLFPTLFDSQTFEVDVEYNTKEPGRFRVVEPYANWTSTQAYLTFGHGHNHYMYINASEPDNVFIETSPIGLEMLQYGEVALSCDYTQLCDEWGRDLLDMLGIKSGGTLTDGVISFNEKAGVRLFLSNVGWCLTNCFNNPDYNDDLANELGEAYPVLPYTPGDFKLDLKKSFNSICDVVVDDEGGEVEYYTLQGIKTANPTPGTVCIKVCGKQAKPVLVK